MRSSLPIEESIGQRLLLAFAGKDAPSPEIVDALRRYKPAGITLFRHLNIDGPAQVRDLTQGLQTLARQAGLPPLLIAADQEGGQLMTIGDGTTPLPGNLALGAAASTDLARQAGEVLGEELAALGINVNYAPCCDVNVNPANPVVGTRAFGEDPRQVAELSAAMTAGLQSKGVAATAKHFPGHGDTASDSHHGVPVVPHSLDRLRDVEFPPFAASIRAGVQLLMTAHLSLPAVDGRDDLPATLSPAILQGLLRRELGFDGVIVTDALDMAAIHQGDGLGPDAVRAAAAGSDLLLLTSNPDDWQRVYASLLQAAQAGQLDPAGLEASSRRIAALKAWLAAHASQPDLSVVGCAAHRAVADEIAGRSITLVRDQAHWLPLPVNSSQRLAVVLPRPQDLTPADTSSYITPKLAQEMRTFHPAVDEFILPHAPQEADIAALLPQLRQYSAVVVGTLNAFAQPAQAALARAVLQTGIPTVVAALRMPYDLTAFPEAPTYVCTYSIMEPAMRALARALFGQAAFQGRLPVSIPGLYAAGHGFAI